MKKSFLSRSVAALLLMTSAPLIAGELPFNAPDTARAKASGELLHRAAHAFYDLNAARGSHAQQISDLWLFPTADDSTVFAQYRTRSGQPGAPQVEHLVLLTLNADRLVRVKELTEARPGPRVADVQEPGLPWTVVSTASHGTPTANHWTALIGTGHVSEPAGVAENTSSSSPSHPRSMAEIDPTAAFGTGHVAGSNESQSAKSAGGPAAQAPSSAGGGDAPGG